MQSMRCAACGLEFRPRRQVPEQRYCSSAVCQRERRRRWQAARLGSDADYRANQRAAQRAWSERHPEYWRTYRQAHPQYVERNRGLQRERDRAQGPQGELAKMDASTLAWPLPSGTYRLQAVGPGELAKMDAWTVEITVVSNS